MRSKIHLLATVVAVSCPALAFAQEDGRMGHMWGSMFNQPEFYVGAAGGYNDSANSDLKGGPFNLNAEFDGGWTALGTAGYRFSSGIRTELELGYRHNNVDSISGVNGHGRSFAWTGMANVLYDIANKSPFTPYIGAGVGAARVTFSNIGPVGATQVNDDDWAPAVQGIVGASYQINNNLSLFANYQYLYAFDVDFKTRAGTKVDADYKNNTFLLGVRLGMGKKERAHEMAVAEPAPAPAPVEPAPSAETAPLSYLVFFDFDRSNITEEARKVLRTAVENFNKGDQSVRIQVTGHADRSGTDAYNMALSERRAQAVKKELVRLGLKSAQVHTTAKGEREPLVPTEDGVKEPQNRRVEIMHKQ